MKMMISKKRKSEIEEDEKKEMNGRRTCHQWRRRKVARRTWIPLISLEEEEEDRSPSTPLHDPSSSIACAPSSPPSSRLSRVSPSPPPPGYPFPIYRQSSPPSSSSPPPGYPFPVYRPILIPSSSPSSSSSTRSVTSRFRPIAMIPIPFSLSSSPSPSPKSSSSSWSPFPPAAELHRRPATPAAVPTCIET